MFKLSNDLIRSGDTGKLKSTTLHFVSFLFFFMMKMWFLNWVNVARVVFVSR